MVVETTFTQTNNLVSQIRSPSPRYLKQVLGSGQQAASAELRRTARIKPRTPICSARYDKPTQLAQKQTYSFARYDGRLDTVVLMTRHMIVNSLSFIHDVNLLAIIVHVVVICGSTQVACFDMCFG
jgi:hypothetical protein